MKASWRLASPEQLWRELAEVGTPVNPSMPSRRLEKNRSKAMLFEDIHRGEGISHEAIILAGAQPDKLDVLLQFGIVQYVFMTFFPVTAARTDARSGAEHADVGKLIQRGESRGQCLAATHGQSGNGTVRFVRINAVVAFRIGHDVAAEILLELIAWRAAGRSGVA